MRIAAILASLTALVLSILWVVYKPGFDSAAAVAAALAASFSAFFLKRNRGKLGQTQKVSSSSIGIQAGRDANVGKLNNK
jgi:hypothetical protein